MVLNVGLDGVFAADRTTPFSCRKASRCNRSKKALDWVSKMKEGVSKGKNLAFESVGGAPDCEWM